MEILTAKQFEYYRQFAALPKEEKVRFIQSLTDEEALHLRYTWEAWARDKQLEPHGDEWAVWLILAGRGCIAAGTQIYNPVTDKHISVEVLAEKGEEIWVLALTSEGPKPSRATAPFVKGRAPLYRVTLEDGKEITTTLFHRFLTPDGWKMLSSLQVGDLLACFQASYQEITSIVFEREDIFYDLTVPLHANYLANGIWNHNSGKTRTGAEWIRKQVETGRYKRIALVGRTSADVRDVMLYGESGLMTNSPPWFKPKHEGTRRRVIWPNGAIATTYSAEEPDSLRGPQHDCAWMDEVCLTGDTLVLTNKGEVPIEQIKQGDFVSTRQGMRKVVKSWCTSESAEVYRLQANDGRTITGTENHPLWVEGKGFIPLTTICFGERLGVQHGEAFCIAIEKLPERMPVYNMEVEDVHEYYANTFISHNCAWRTSDTYDQLMFGLRLGAHPRAIVTTTPRPTKEIKQLIKLRTTFVTRGNTYENRDNLANMFFDQIITRYEGSRLGRQELLAELLDDAEGALWKRDAMIEAYRVAKAPDLVRIVVGVDPAVTSEEDSDETGIVVAGKGVDGHLYILDDLSIRGTPKEWATQAVSAYYKYQADRIIGEGNQGGDMVENTVRMVDKYVAYKKVHSKRGKYARAEPIAALYEQGKGHHVGMFPELEDQLCSWEQGVSESPDRLDALVHSATELMLEGYMGGGGMLSMQHLNVAEEEEFNPFW